MSVKHYVQNGLFQVAHLTFLGVGSLAIAASAQAASLDISTWDRLGDVDYDGTTLTLTNAADGDDLTNYNVPGNFLLSAFALETHLVLNPGDLGGDAFEGSAVRTILNNVQAGDRLTINWDFVLQDLTNLDRAFLTVGNSVVLNLDNLLTPYTYTFTSSGNFQVGIGVLDVNDAGTSSQLAIRNVEYTPIPTPSLLFGSIALALKTMQDRKRLNQRADNRSDC